MTRRPLAQTVAEHIIRRACRRLPAATRDEHYREWTAELPAILDDRDIRSVPRRSARALHYALGVARSARRLRGPGELPPADTRQPGIFPRPDGVLPALAAVILWGSLLAVANAFPSAFSSADPWLPALLIATFSPNVLSVVAIVRFVLWVRRRSRGTPAP